MKPSRKLLPVAGIISLGAMSAPMAQAAAVDVSGVVTEIGLQVAPIVSVGTAILAVIVAVKVFNWVRSAIH